MIWASSFTDCTTYLQILEGSNQIGVFAINRETMKVRELVLFLPDWSLSPSPQWMPHFSLALTFDDRWNPEQISHHIGLNTFNLYPKRKLQWNYWILVKTHYSLVKTEAITAELIMLVIEENSTQIKLRKREQHTISPKSSTSTWDLFSFRFISKSTPSGPCEKSQYKQNLRFAFQIRLFRAGIMNQTFIIIIIFMVLF